MRTMYTINIATSFSRLIPSGSQFVPNFHVSRADGGLIFRISSERSFYGRRNATICAGKVLHYDNGRHQSCHLMSFLDGTSTVKNPLHFSPANPHPCTSYSLSSDLPRISPGAITSCRQMHLSMLCFLFQGFDIMRNSQKTPK